MATMEQPAMEPSTTDATWYKDAIIYQVHVRAFRDSNGDGIGDFRGLTQNLSYLQDLGITTVWLLPFYPSPLKDDGYDIADYMNVNPSYGTMADFRNFLREAHDRGLRVITELVLNHTSDQHPWFKRSRTAKPGTRARDFYVWSDTPNKYRDARIIFKDFETSNWAWDPVAKAYYWHRFYSHQPDLNFDNPEVHEALLHVIDHWLKMGVDGVRLDAVPYLYEREGTTCENLPETHEFLKKLRRHVDENFPNRMLLAEANQWPDDAIAYFGNEDECHTAFHFPLMPRLFMSLQMEDRFPVVDILQQTPAIGSSCQWVLFLRNHDELTLEMVTDEERDYMYRVYAADRRARINLGIRRRLAPLLGNNRRKIELMNGLLLSLPGAPVIYYGDEIGMGDNIYLGDRDGVRTPMQWCADRNGGFSRANPQQLYLPPIIDFEYHYESVNVETQHNNPQSLLWWMRRLIAQRQLHQSFSRGSLEMLTPNNPKILAFIRAIEDEQVLVVANLSRYAQYAELDLSRYEGWTPVELFGQTKFAKIGKVPYMLTPGPHAFYWFALRPPKTETAADVHCASGRPAIQISGPEQFDEVFEGRARFELERLLRGSLATRRWFGGKARTIQATEILDVVPFGNAGETSRAHLVLVQVEYIEGEADTYVLALGMAEGQRAGEMLKDAPQSVIARITYPDQHGEAVVFDAMTDLDFDQSLLDAIARRRRARGEVGELLAWSTPALKRLRGDRSQPLPAAVMGKEQSNSSVSYGDRLVLKLFRRVEAGINPDLEIGRFLTEKTQFRHVPPVAGALEYRRDRQEPLTLGILQGFVANEGTAWDYTRDMLGRYFEHSLAQPPEQRQATEVGVNDSLLKLAGGSVPASIETLAHEFWPSAALLGRRTAELHIALASHAEDPAFAPEPFSQLYQRSMYQSMRRLAGKTFQLLRSRAPELAESAQQKAMTVLEHEKGVLQCLRAVLEHKIAATRIRIHGDYHLGQVLYTGKDFVIIDFEGEPARPLGERRIKRSPLQDVAGMIRSFHYAASSALFRHLENAVVSPDDAAVLKRYAYAWYAWASATFLKSYLAVADGQSFLPRASDQLQALLHGFLLEKAIYELAYELNNRPKWVEVPLRGVINLLEYTHCEQSADGQTPNAD
jgi:maltose alpha-D-glucosyltransferase/alpha-amylase